MHKALGVLTPWLVVSLALVLTAGAVLADELAPESVAGPLVSLDGVPLDLSPAPLRLAGEILAPLAPLAAAVGADLQSTRDPNFISLIREEVTVRMWLGQLILLVNNNAPVSLKVGPLLVGEDIYVPLTPLATAWGGTLTWEPLTETANLALAPEEEEAGLHAAGMLIQIYRGTPPIFLVQSQHAEQAGVYVAAENLVLLRGKVGEQLRIVDLDAIHLGDQVELTLTEQDQVVVLRASYGEKTGQLQAVAENRLILGDGTLLELSPEVRVHTPEDEDVDLASVEQGAEVTVRYNPVVNLAWDITVAEPQAESQEPEIRVLAVSLVNYTRPLRAGEVLRVQILGTGGGEARFKLEDQYTDLPALENRPGRYVGQFTVPAEANLLEAAVTAVVEKEGLITEPLAADQTVTFDTAAPLVGHLVPAQDLQIANLRPILGANYEDSGSGVDRESVRFILDGEELAEGLVTTRRKAAMQAPLLDPGVHQVEFMVQDLAGNERVARWSFTVQALPGMPLESVTHNALRPLNEQDTLVVQACSSQPLVEPVVDLGTWKQNLPMEELEDEEGYLYQFSYDVQIGDRVDSASVAVRARDQAENEVGLASLYPLTIITGLPQELVITQPQAGEVVGSEVTIAGMAPPGSAIRITINYRDRIIFEVAGQVVQGVVEATEEGRWETQPVNLRIPFIGTADHYEIVCELLDEAEEVLQTETVEVVGH